MQALFLIYCLKLLNKATNPRIFQVEIFYLKHNYWNLVLFLCYKREGGEIWLADILIKYFRSRWFYLTNFRIFHFNDFWRNGNSLSSNNIERKLFRNIVFSGVLSSARNSIFRGVVICRCILREISISNGISYRIPVNWWSRFLEHRLKGKLYNKYSWQVCSCLLAFLIP